MVEGLKSRVTTGSKGVGVRKKRSGRAGQRTQDAEVLKGDTNGFQGAEAKVKGGEKGGRRSCGVGDGERQVLEGVVEGKWSLRDTIVSETFL